MRRIIAFWLFLSVLLSFTSCSKKAAHSLDRAERNAYSESSALLASVRAMPLAKAYLAAATERFIAVQHKLEVASTDERLAPAWQSVIRSMGARDSAGNIDSGSPSAQEACQKSSSHQCGGRILDVRE